MQSFLNKLFEGKDFDKYDKISRKLSYKNISFFIRILITAMSLLVPVIYILLINNDVIYTTKFEELAAKSEIFIYDFSHTLDALLLLIWTPIDLLLFEYLVSLFFPAYSMHITLNSIFVDKKADGKILQKMTHLSADEKVKKLRWIIIKKLIIYDVFIGVLFFAALFLEARSINYIDDDGVHIKKVLGVSSKHYSWDDIEKIETACRYRNSLYQQRIFKINWYYLAHMKDGIIIDLASYRAVDSRIDQLIKFHNLVTKKGIPYGFVESDPLSVDAVTCVDYIVSSFIMENDAEKLINILTVTD
ncbi:hypothetical protein GUI12_00570 [Anaplasmataceae bacterium AB001_6]|nr:hypothetical protein GUI12_00570 [Anaplasmataceae bacterium AB001_6]